jgi:hypothetical protein
MFLNSSVTTDSKQIQKNYKNYKNGFFWFKYKNYFVKIATKTESSDDDFLSVVVDEMNSFDKNKKSTEKKTYAVQLAYPSNLEKIDISDFTDYNDLKSRLVSILELMKDLPDNELSKSGYLKIAASIVDIIESINNSELLISQSNEKNLC